MESRYGESWYAAGSRRKKAQLEKAALAFNSWRVVDKVLIQGITLDSSKARFYLTPVACAWVQCLTELVTGALRRLSSRAARARERQDDARGCCVPVSEQDVDAHYHHWGMASMAAMASSLSLPAGLQ